MNSFTISSFKAPEPDTIRMRAAADKILEFKNKHETLPNTIQLATFGLYKLDFGTDISGQWIVTYKRIVVDLIIL